MQKIDYPWIALRSVEIQRAFSNSGSSELAYLDLPNIIRVGQITRLANMLRRRGIVKYDSVRALGALLGMQPDTIKSNIQIMEELGWVSYSKSKGNTQEYVEDHVPNLKSVLDILGKTFSEEVTDIPNVMHFSPIEKSSILTLHLCARMPCTVEALKSELNLDVKKYQKVITLGSAGNFLESITLDDEKTALWSPIYYYNQYENIKKFMQRQTVASLTPIGEVMELCAETVGAPLKLLSNNMKDAAVAGIKCGAILPLTIWMPTKNGQVDYTFLFPPLSKFEDSDPEGDFLEKSKVLLASIRLGENFAPRSQIRDPLQVIRKLKFDGKLSRPHSDAYNQYKVPASKGIFVLKEEEGTTYYGNRQYTGWMPYLIQSDSNKKALDITESLITPSTQRISDTLVEDVKVADEVFKQSLTSLESLELRGSKYFKETSADPELLDAAQHMAVVVYGGAYE